MSYQVNKQTDIFLSGEADKWFERNFADSGKKNMQHDMALNYLKGCDLNAHLILEIGCADGWRLNELNKLFNCECVGIEPSSKAIEAGMQRYANIKFMQGTADSINLNDASVDCIVIGFCLYLCDRADLFKIASEVDRVLKDKGILVITDFMPPFPYANRYCHKEGVLSYKMDYSSMFLWNPFYRKIYFDVMPMTGDRSDTSVDARVGLVVLQKNAEDAYPLEPFQ
ncbi:MAG: class I SAM-dependent methyltransferase [Oceanospirillaceae bacterium]|nr:class I SAM-dependent methyltransferase [Oceanospirillaceae bacterium]MCP5350108.1 class I SAM-dependent methyltransferase [Oceanospirillaceae bacterium]